MRRSINDQQRLFGQRWDVDRDAYSPTGQQNFGGCDPKLLTDQDRNTSRGMAFLQGAGLMDRRRKESPPSGGLKNCLLARHGLGRQQVVL